MVRGPLRPGARAEVWSTGGAPSCRRLQPACSPRAHRGMPAGRFWPHANCVCPVQQALKSPGAECTRCSTLSGGRTHLDFVQLQHQVLDFGLRHGITLYAYDGYVQVVVSGKAAAVACMVRRRRKVAQSAHSEPDTLTDVAARRVPLRNGADTKPATVLMPRTILLALLVGARLLPRAIGELAGRRGVGG